jgi:anaerobic magnesium-protoporphyrin IX monomethyl ester cyclase
MARLVLIPAPFVEARGLVAYVPYGLLSLQAAAKQRGVDVALLQFAELSGLTFETSDALARRVADLVGEPDAVGLSTMCSSFHHSLGIAVELKQRYPKLQVWMGGPHASAKPMLLLDRFPEIEAVFAGEGEATLSDLMGGWPSLESCSLAGLPGVYTRDSVFVQRPLIPDLNELPFVGDAPDFLPLLSSSADSSTQGIPLEAERGCAGRCSFCSTASFWGNRVRYKSSGRLLEEMNKFNGLTGETFFSLVGDNLAASRRELMNLCEALVTEDGGYRWDCSLTLDNLRHGDLDLLWSAGCRTIFVGLESGSQQTLQRIGKGIDLAHSVELLRYAIEIGFTTSVSLIVGFPWETMSQLRETYNLHARLLEQGAQSSVTALCPLPGTSLELTELVEGGKGSSFVALDGLPHGPRSETLIGRCPELFTQFGRFATAAVSPVDVGTIVLAAGMLRGHHERRRGETPSTTGQACA